jgi:hypothetical protein
VEKFFFDIDRTYFLCRIRRTIKQLQNCLETSIRFRLTETSSFYNSERSLLRPAPLLCITTLINTSHRNTFEQGISVVNTKWVFRKKGRSDGTLKFKARITGRGFTQIAGESLDKTDAPTTRPESWKTMIALALRNNYIIE